jgi:hypothetical protein
MSLTVTTNNIMFAEDQIETLRTSKRAYEEKKQREAEEKRLREKTIKSTIFQRYGDSVLPPSAGPKKPKASRDSVASRRVISNPVQGNTSSSKVLSEICSAMTYIYVSYG